MICWLLFSGFIDGTGNRRPLYYARRKRLTSQGVEVEAVIHVGEREMIGIQGVLHRSVEEQARKQGYRAPKFLPGRSSCSHG
jgi:hypothetical protein